MSVQPHIREERPWGFFDVLTDAEDCKIKRIVVSPQKRLSLQSHQHRQEDWVVVRGKGKAVVGNTIHTLLPGSHVRIPPNVRHRLINDHENQTFHIIEIQTGTSFDETDIIRYEDDYGR